MFIHVKVFTKAKAERVEKKSDTHFNVWVKEKAERNLANTRIICVFKGFFKTNGVRIINGHNSPSKLLSVDVDEK